MRTWKASAAALWAVCWITAAPVPAALAQDVTVRLTIKNHRFEPADVEVPAGKKIKLIVKNEDPTPEEFESLDLRREKIVTGGAEITLFIGPLQPGVYVFFGDFHPDTARGRVTAK